MIFASLNKESGKSKTLASQRLRWKSGIRVEPDCHHTLVIDLYYQVACSFLLSKAKMKWLLAKSKCNQDLPKLKFNKKNSVLFL